MRVETVFLSMSDTDLTEVYEPRRCESNSDAGKRACHDTDSQDFVRFIYFLQKKYIKN